jgi:hypothetical protein
MSLLKEQETRSTNMNEEDSVSEDNLSKHDNSVSNDSSSYAPSPSGSISSTTVTSYTGTSNRGGIPERILASRETRHVKSSRIMVLAVMFITATIAGGMTWYWIKEAEQRNFDTQVSNSITVENCAFYMCCPLLTLYVFDIFSSAISRLRLKMFRLITPTMSTWLWKASVLPSLLLPLPWDPSGPT